MGYFNPDVYYQPEAFDLVPVGEIDMYEPCWDFDIVAVWQHTPTGDLYWARDSGCSCPSPFEDFRSLDSLTKLSSETLDEFEREIADCYQADRAQDLLRKVHVVLAG